MTVLVPGVFTPRSVMHECSAAITTPTARGESSSCRLGDLLGQPLLSLRAAGKMLYDSCQLGQADDALAGKVGDARFAGKWQKVVLAQGADWDVPDHHQLVVLLFVGEGGQIELPRGQHLRPGLGHAGRGAFEVHRFQIHAQGLQKI